MARNAKSRRGEPRRLFALHDREEISVLGRPGSDLLFQALRLSTIGAGEFNGRVRDGIGFSLPANTTRPAKDGIQTTAIGKHYRRHRLDKLDFLYWVSFALVIGLFCYRFQSTANRLRLPHSNSDRH